MATAPVYRSESGTWTNPHAAERCPQHDARCLRHIRRYVARTDLDFAY